MLILKLTVMTTTNKVLINSKEIRSYTMRLENVLGWSYSPTTNELTIEMAYLGGVLSVNRYKWGVFTRPEVRQWMDELAFIIRAMVNSQGLKFDVPLKVKVDGQFINKRATPDLHNIGKIVMDSVEDAVGINDRDFVVTIGKPQIGEEAKLIITIGGNE